MKYYLPVYKNESNTEYVLPQIQEFNSVVDGKVKPGVSVLIKNISGTWTEQTTYGAGVKVVTKTTNPTNNATAYLGILAGDYNLTADCCGTFNGGSGGGGTGGNGGTGGDAGRIQWDANTSVGDGGDYDKSYDLAYTNTADVILGVWNTGNMAIDWGDATLRKYPESRFILKSFVADDNPTITVHWKLADNEPDSISTMDDEGGFKATLDSITGDIPTALRIFNAADKLAALPALPTTIRQIGIGGTSLNTAGLNTLLDALNSGPVSSGQLFAITSPRSDATLSKLTALAAKGWKVTAWGIAPNL